MRDTGGRCQSLIHRAHLNRSPAGITAALAANIGGSIFVCSSSGKAKDVLFR
jgi:hypothetical protein